jgi:hypothetical protein
MYTYHSSATCNLSLRKNATTVCVMLGHIHVCVMLGHIHVCVMLGHIHVWAYNSSVKADFVYYFVP